MRANLRILNRNVTSKNKINDLMEKEPILNHLVKTNVTNKVFQPLRFVEASYNFTPVQRDFIMLVQDKTKKQEIITNDFSINLKPYFKEKGADLKNVRVNHFKEICDDLINSKMSFQYLKGKTRYSSHALFTDCYVDRDFNLKVTINDNALPLFYINKLEEGHFKDNKLIKGLFQSSYPDFDPYVSYLPQTFIKFKESSTKVLFTRLISNRKVSKLTHEFTKDELYNILGYGYYSLKENNDPQQNIFDLQETVFIQEKYVGSDGWRDFRKLLNKWLKEISELEESRIKIIPDGTNFFTAKGRPIRTIQIKVEYEEELETLSEQDKKSFFLLKEKGLSRNQILNIIRKYSFEEIDRELKSHLVKIRDHYNKPCLGERKRTDYRKIDNVAGYVYGVIFKLGQKNNTIGKQNPH